MTLKDTSSMEKKTPTATILPHRNSNRSIEVAVGPIKSASILQEKSAAYRQGIT